MSGEPPVRVGLAGLGNSGWFYHAQQHLATSADYELVAVCSRDLDRARAAGRRFDCRALTSWQQLVADDDVELVVIALPHDLHRDVAVAAVNAGKHVLVEKPMAVTTADADDMISAARKAGVLLSVFHQRRWEQDFQVLRGLVADGVIGDIWHVEVARSHSGPYRTAGEERPHVGDAVLEWPHKRARGGGISYLVGPHPVDQLLQLVGSPAQTVAGRVHHHPGEDVEHYIAAEVSFSTGASGRVSVFRRSGISPPRFAVYGTRGTLLSQDGTEVHIQPFDGDRRSIGDLQPPSLLGNEVYAGLYGAIRHGTPLPVTAEEGRAVVEVLDLALRSAAGNGAPLPCAGA